MSARRDEARWRSVEQWRELAGVHHKHPDPFLVWAAATGWRNYPGPRSKPPHPICRVIDCILRRLRLARPVPEKPDGRRRPVILEFEDGNALKELRAKLGSVENPPVAISPLYRDGALFATAQVTSVGLELLARHADLGKWVKRFDLSDVIVPEQSVPLITNIDKLLKPQLHGEVLLGVVDNGCPFAHALFSEAIASGRMPGDPHSATRVAAFWDQQESEESNGYGHPPDRFGYGREVFRHYDDTWNGLSDAIRELLASGPQDEEVYYAETRIPSMRRRAVHGPHVMDVLAGPIRVRDRIYRDRDTPPTWSRAGDVAGDPKRSDIAFVQLPLECLQDSSGVWLDSYILDAVQYILSCRSGDTEKTVINISYGNTIGPHDGSSILGRALSDLIVESGESVKIVMAGGNSFPLRGHAHFSASPEGTELTWRIPPGSKTPHFLQIWLPKGLGLDVANVKVALQAPGDAEPQFHSFNDAGPSPHAPRGGVFKWADARSTKAVVSLLATPSRAEGSALAFLAVSPTELAFEEASEPAPHGDWKVIVSASKKVNGIHAYIARNDQDIGGPLLGRQSYFVDDVDERERYLRERRDDPGGASRDAWLSGNEDVSAVVKRRGTLNGVSAGSKVISVAGYSREFSEDPNAGRHSHYSAAGWLRTGDDRVFAPESALPTDESLVLRGLRAAGSRSGSTFRLVGTSTAAPQRARRLASEYETGRVDPGLPPVQTPGPSDGELDGAHRLVIETRDLLQAAATTAAATTAATAAPGDAAPHTHPAPGPSSAG